MYTNTNTLGKRLEGLLDQYYRNIRKDVHVKGLSIEDAEDISTSKLMHDIVCMLNKDFKLGQSSMEDSA